MSTLLKRKLKLVRPCINFTLTELKMLNVNGIFENMQTSEVLQMPYYALVLHTCAWFYVWPKFYIRNNHILEL